MSLRILPSGDHALLAELDGLDEVLALYRALDAERPAGVVDLVPAARTIGVVVDPGVLPLSVAQAWVERTRPVVATPRDEHAVEILVHYDGQDLAAVAGLLGIGAREVVDLHTSSSWRVAFGGFAPGFGYLVTDHDRLRVPRRATPRTAVPAGSVGLAGEFSGVYPRSSPGGWQLIGTTDAVLWDAAADPPALLRPGALVRFREAT
ncbi:5-oxoprolinase subunit PxpB [Leifsonia naganoensis]|uniref:KipI family sensor histidine kinase inhibitor n=1 Tax=Leifsonia naganoensis TaxID=150025 RepID=A0A853DNS4_9MICO|nr:KipI family sensor histidine kinase inhibitor [Leifsonia naganoensis]